MLASTFMTRGVASATAFAELALTPGLTGSRARRDVHVGREGVVVALLAAPVLPGLVRTAATAANVPMTATAATPLRATTCRRRSRFAWR
jgi:hypothetical protein